LNAHQEASLDVSGQQRDQVEKYKDKKGNYKPEKKRSAKLPGEALQD
jgi:hypothetical protein